MDVLLWFTFAVILIIIFSYWGWFYMAFTSDISHNKTIPAELPPITVIVCFKNAANQVCDTIRAILIQDYPHFEVIAIDDFSIDGGYEKLLEIENSRLHRMKAQIDMPGKKQALTEAILAARNDILLFTDADCMPSSDNWITSMVTKMVESEKTEIVLGYGPLHKKNGWLNSFARYETVLTAMQYFTYASSGKAYMGVGRNLMYRKSIFGNVNGYQNHTDIISGDDDLFVSIAANDINTAVNMDKIAFVFSDAKSNLAEFLRQKSRHISTSPRYKFKHKLFLGLFAASQIGFYILLLISCLAGYFTIISVLFLLLLKWTIQMICQRPVFKKLDVEDLFWRFPILDILMVWYYISILIYSTIRKQHW